MFNYRLRKFSICQQHGASLEDEAPRANCGIGQARGVRSQAPAMASTGEHTVSLLARLPTQWWECSGAPVSAG
uniref:Uncharacterized protein n=1 Tax=Aegilops tauschii subsp. strangulata TaxID=200361 RepID=A0A453SN91_AEGTS